MKDSFNIGQFIYTLRINAGYKSLGELNKVSGVSVATLSRIEANVQRPSSDTLRKLSKPLKVTHEYLLSSIGYMDDTAVKDDLAVLKQEYLPFFLKANMLSKESIELLDKQVEILLKLESRF